MRIVVILFSYLTNPAIEFTAGTMRQSMSRLTARREERLAAPATDKGVRGLPITSMNNEHGPPADGGVPSKTLTV